MTSYDESSDLGSSDSSSGDSSNISSDSSGSSSSSNISSGSGSEEDDYDDSPAKDLPFSSNSKSKKRARARNAPKKGQSIKKKSRKRQAPKKCSSSSISLSSSSSSLSFLSPSLLSWLVSNISNRLIFSKKGYILTQFIKENELKGKEIKALYQCKYEIAVAMYAAKKNKNLEYLQVLHIIRAVVQTLIQTFIHQQQQQQQPSIPHLKENKFSSSTSSTSSTSEVISLISSSDDEENDIKISYESNFGISQLSNIQPDCFICGKGTTASDCRCISVEENGMDCGLTWHSKCAESISSPTKKKSKKRQSNKKNKTIATTSCCIYCTETKQLHSAIKLRDVKSVIQCLSSYLASPLFVMSSINTDTSNPNNKQKYSNDSALSLALISSGEIIRNINSKPRNVNSSSSSTTTSINSRNLPPTLLRENASLDIIRSLLNYSSLLHHVAKGWRVPHAPFLHAIGLINCGTLSNYLNNSYLQKCSLHVQHQLYQRTNLYQFQQKCSTSCSMSDISGGIEKYPISISNNSPKEKIDELIDKYNSGQKIYVRSPLESHTVRCIFNISGDSSPKYHCRCKTNSSCNPTNNKGNQGSCGNLHGQEYHVYHVCNFKCSCFFNYDQPCGGTTCLMGINVRVQLFWREDMNEWGLKAMETIRAGTIIGEYPGLLQSGQVARVKVHHLSNGHKQLSGSMLAAFDATPSNCKLPCGVEIDAAKYHGATYYINHSCKGANLIVKQFCDASRQVEVAANKRIDFRRMLFVAKKKIDVGEELTFSYEKDGTTKAKNRFLNGSDCLCKSCVNRKK